MRWAYILAIVVGMVGFTGNVAYAAKYLPRDYKATYYLRHHVGKVPECDRHARTLYNLEESIYKEYGTRTMPDGKRYVREKGMDILMKYAPKIEARADKCLAKYKKGWK